MTNRDFTHTLNSKEFAQWLRDEPWRLYANGRYIDDKIPYVTAIEEWLDMEWKLNGHF